MIILKDINKIYSDTLVNTVALSNVSLKIKEGEFVMLLGPSGSGKSTLLNVASGLDSPSSGTVTIDNQDISKYTQRKLTLFRRKNLGFIFQQYNLLQSLTVKENIEVGIFNKNTSFDIDTMLNNVDLYHYKNKYPYQLSGGEQQRVSIARALIKNPKILFCDEPTGALDENNAKEILSFLKKLNKMYNTTIVLITHNTSISVIADTIIKLNSGKIVDIVSNSNPKDVKDIIWG